MSKNKQFKDYSQQSSTWKRNNRRNHFRGEILRDDRYRKEGRRDRNRYSNGKNQNEKKRTYLTTDRLNSDLDKYFMKV